MIAALVASCSLMVDADAISGGEGAASGDIEGDSEGIRAAGGAPNAADNTSYAGTPSTAGALNSSCANDDLRDCDGDPDNGCETNIMTSLQHCGRCFRSCAYQCVDGFCTLVSNGEGGGG